MGNKKCCVGGCNATSETHRLFSFPKNDKLRNLWVSFLVRTNSLLIGLSKEQLLRKRVCEKHFDKYQFDHDGRRLRYSYPCLLTHKEIAHGVPLCVAGWNVTQEHNYSKEEGADPSALITITGRNTIEHDYSKERDENNVTKSTEVTGSVTDLMLEQPSCSGMSHAVNTDAVLHKTQTPKRTSSAVLLKILREDTIRTRNIQCVHDDGSVNISGYDVSVFYDPPHLLKGLRNNFMTKEIIWEGKTASWKDIEFVFDINSKLGHTKALPKLTAHHVDPFKMKKMKVSVPAQVLSARMAAMLKYTNAVNILHSGENNSTMATTAEFVEFIDKLFDSVNGYPGGSKAGKLRRAVKDDSPHDTFWVDSIKKLKSLNFIDKQSKHALVRKASTCESAVSAGLDHYPRKETRAPILFTRMSKRKHFSGSEYVKKGKATILLRAGHQYSKKCKYKNGGVLWECTTRKQSKCAGSITVMDNQVVAEKRHNVCEPDFARNEVTLRLFKLKTTLADPEAPAIPTAYNAAVSSLKDTGIDKIKEFPALKSIKTTLYKHRNAAFEPRPIKSKDIEAYLQSLLSSEGGDTDDYERNEDFSDNFNKRQDQIQNISTEKLLDKIEDSVAPDHLLPLLSL
ncbi:hypothetical protein PYW07_006592 [Mythimna separata]|uniref:THAP-type domain-containing protein n=1 Tax=Mythimna separata TaxID=271217 RepID=A0AAD7YUT3_MYTSE|nr:hypothetical protein PYW07_006592 [Mythimna separata]